MIRGDFFLIGYKNAFPHRNCMGTLKYGSSFIDLIEHGYIQHIRSTLDSPGDLLPEKFAFIPWNFIGNVSF